MAKRFYYATIQKTLSHIIALFSNDHENITVAKYDKRVVFNLDEYEDALKFVISNVKPKIGQVNKRIESDAGIEYKIIKPKGELYRESS